MFFYSQEGDEEALAVKYDCKLVYRLENEFSPYTRCDAKDVMLKLATFVVDPRFQGSSLFLKLYGDALGPVADTVKTAYNYIIKAADIKPRKVRTCTSSETFRWTGWTMPGRNINKRSGGEGQ